MEPATVFAAFIGAMCVIHLMWEASEQIAKWWADRRSEQARAAVESTKKVIRSDWYVFFSCSDLWGKELERRPGQAGKSVDKKRSKPNHRPVARITTMV
jgi:hypothetical protein